MTLGGFTSGAHYTAIADLNNDGRDDLIIACDRKKYDIVWFKTPTKITDISAWKKHIVYRNDSHRTYHVETGDIDGDGDTDIVGVGATDPGLVLLINSRAGESWDIVLIEKLLSGFGTVRIADIDKDGKNDIIAKGNGGAVYLYSYFTDPANPMDWKRWTIASHMSGGVFELADMDGDGDIDILAVDYRVAKLYLLQNPYPTDVRRSEWARYLIDNDCDAREIAVGDIDGDGDMDIIIADEGMYSSQKSANSVIWFKNDGRTFYNNWERHIVDKSDKYLNWCHHVELSDIDGDGDFDIAVAAAGSNTFLLYFKINKVIDE